MDRDRPGERGPPKAKVQRITENSRLTPSPRPAPHQPLYDV